MRIVEASFAGRKSVEPQTNPEGYTYCHWISVKNHMGLSLVNVSVL